MMTRVLFYSPMVTADTQRPSGLARVAAHHVMALTRAGYAVSIPALPLACDFRGDPKTQSHNRQTAELAASNLLARIENGTEPRPDLWFSYHVYYKSPDWIGPRVCDALGIPYVVAEGSHAPKRAHGPWHEGHIAATQALSRAHCLLASTAFDRVCLERLAPGRVSDLKPFIDVAPFASVVRSQSTGVRVLTTAMMRDTRKLSSYRLLAAAMNLIDDDTISLTIAGDGVYRREVEAAFVPAQSRHAINFAGAILPEEIAARAGAADFFAWPGIGEAYGIAYLEAQASGLPVVACRDRGVPDVVEENRTALLSPAGDPAALARNIRLLMRQPQLRESLGLAGRRFVNVERSVEAASARLRQVLGGVLC